MKYNIKVDSFHVQKSTDDYLLILFFGSNVIAEVSVKSEKQGHYVGSKALQDGYNSETLGQWYA